MSDGGGLSVESELGCGKGRIITDDNQCIKKATKEALVGVSPSHSSWPYS